MRLDEAERRLAIAIDYAIEHDLDTYHWYLLAGRATLRVRQGAWDAAELEIRQLLRQPMLSSVTRIVALTPLGQVHARRGSPEAAAALDEALTLAERTGQLSRLGPVRAARAEAALLDGDKARARRRGAGGARSGLRSWQSLAAGRNRLAAVAGRRAGRPDRRSGRAIRPSDRRRLGRGCRCLATSSAAPTKRRAPWPKVMIPALVHRAVAIFEELGAKPAIAQRDRSPAHARRPRPADASGADRGPQPGPIRLA